MPEMQTIVKKANPFKRLLVRILVPGVLVTAILIFGPMAIGVRGVALNHSMARVHIEAATPGVDQEQVRQAMHAIEGFRSCQVALESILATNVWRAEMEFEADSMTEATVRLFKWQEQLKLPVRVTAEKLTYQSLRLRRPGRGDIVFGVPQVLLREDLNDSLAEGHDAEK